MMTDDEHNAHKATVREIAEKLVQDAASVGVVLTIEQVSLQPPAMGNYKTVVSVRSAAEVYKAQK